MVLLERIELSTSPLPRECSTSELQQQREGAFKAKVWGAQGGGLGKMHKTRKKVVWLTDKLATSHI